jgi:hypothetical protein
MTVRVMRAPHAPFERRWNSPCLISLVKAIRARVQSLANSLAARDPDHFLWGRTHKADNGRVLVIEYEVHG